jgi:hypothetical protein
LAPQDSRLSERRRADVLYLIRSDETLEELPNGATAEVEGEEFVCRDEEGNVVARYPKLDILMFGYDERVKDHVKRAAEERRSEQRESR